jgi:hypothetical protein
MTDLDVPARRIRDAFERELAGYHAPPDLAGRARLGGLRRARRRRLRRVTGVAAVACAAAVTVAAVAARPGAAPARQRPAPAASARLPSAASVGRAMLAAFNGASDDVLYSTEVGLHSGTVVDAYQDWNWPAEPVPGQPSRWRALYSQRLRGSAGPLRPVEDFTFSFVSPPAEATIAAQAQTKVPGRLTMVCYAGTGGCGVGDSSVNAGTWSTFSHQFTAFDVSSGIGAGGMFGLAALAQGIAKGQWRVVRQTRLDGQPAIELSETSKGTIAPMPMLLWVNAQTYLPLKWTGGGIVSGIFAYLRPTPASLALLRVPIPRGYPRSAPG